MFPVEKRPTLFVQTDGGDVPLWDTLDFDKHQIPERWQDADYTSDECIILTKMEWESMKALLEDAWKKVPDDFDGWDPSADRDRWDDVTFDLRAMREMIKKVQP